MTHCPKCSYGWITGPTYCHGCGLGPNHFTEHLHYRCQRCGYTKAEPCHNGAGPR